MVKLPIASARDREHNGCEVFGRRADQPELVFPDRGPFSSVEANDGHSRPRQSGF